MNRYCVLLFLLSFFAISVAYGKQVKGNNSSASHANNSILMPGQQSQGDPGDVVTVSSYGDGKTKEDAIKAALRSALEQTFGTFVSSKTEVLNDDLVSDEIVTISRGNVHRYSEISSSVLPNGNVSVMINATISITKLVNYAKSKGMETELSGATFMMNSKIADLNLKSKVTAMRHFFLTIFENAPDLVDYEIQTAEPYGGRDGRFYVPVTVVCKPNNNMRPFISSINNGLKELKPSLSEMDKYKQFGLNLYDIQLMLDLFEVAKKMYLSSVCTRFVITDNIGNEVYVKRKLGSNDDRKLSSCHLSHGFFSVQPIDYSLINATPSKGYDDDLIHKFDNNYEKVMAGTCIICKLEIPYSKAEMGKLSNLKIATSSEHGLSFDILLHRVKRSPYEVDMKDIMGVDFDKEQLYIDNSIKNGMIYTGGDYGRYLRLLQSLYYDRPRNKYIKLKDDYKLFFSPIPKRE
ncbi:MAG: hypothetical protein MJZ30_08135 [Paludibacteraceae bacterium]|nr:hypothetical protein [Paludibacteraceae bacterium]